MTSGTATRLRNLGRAKPTAVELEVLSNYRPEFRADLLRRWRAGEFYVREGRLAEVNPAAKAHWRRVVDSALERHAKKKARRHASAQAAAKNRALRKSKRSK